MIIDVLETPLRDLGFALAPPEVAQTTTGVALLCYGHLQVTLEPSSHGATVRFFILSSFGDWVAQDVKRWGIPATLRFRDQDQLRRQTPWFTSVLSAVLKQAQLMDPGG